VSEQFIGAKSGRERENEVGFGDHEKKLVAVGVQWVNTE